METLVQPFTPRSSVSEEAEGLRISIPSKWSCRLVFLAVWLTFWTIGGMSAAHSLQRHFNLFLCFWLVGWTAGEVAVTYAILYAIAGSEVISANSETLTCRTQIFGFGWQDHTWCVRCAISAFNPRAVSERAVEQAGSRSTTARKPSGFGADLDEAEAVALIGRIRQRCPIADTSVQEQRKPGSGSPDSLETPILRGKIEVPICPIFNAERP